MDKNTQDRPFDSSGHASPLAWTAWIILGLSGLAGLFVVSLYNYLLFHTLVEMFSIAVAWSVFMLVWNARDFLKNDALLNLGVAFLFIGFLDLLHTLAFKGMGVFAEHWGANLPTQLWIAGRYMEAAALFTFVLLLGRRTRPALSLAGWGGGAALLLLAIFVWRIFPDCFVQGVGLTPFKIGSEYLICLILLAAMALLRQRRKLIDSRVYRLMLASMLVTIFAELSFTLYMDVYGIFNQIGHYFKLISYLLIYLALIQSGLRRPFALLFRALDEEKVALRESEEKHRRLFETMAMGVVYHAFDGTIISANPAAEKILGLSLDQMQGKTSLDPRWKMIKEDGTEVQGPDHPAMITLRTGEIVGPVIRGVFHTGKNAHVWLSITSIPLFQPGEKKTFQVYATFENITERKLAEEVIAQSERRFRMLFDQNKDAILWANKEGFIIRCNPAAQRLFGLDREKLLGLHQTALHPPAKLNYYRERFAQNVQDKSSLDSDAEIVNSAGAIKHVNLFSTIINVDGEEVNQGIFVDITEKHQARLDIERFKLAMDSSSDSFFLIDPVSLRFVDANRQAWEALGLTREKLLRMGPQDVTPHYSREELEKLFNSVADASDQSGTIEDFHVRQDGQRFPVEVKLQKFEQDGKHFFIAVARDVSERKTAEKALLKAKQQAEAANQAKSEFLANMSHEIRTPMNGVIGMTDLLLDTPLASDQKNLAQSIQVSAESLLVLINDILDFSKIEAGHLELENIQFDLHHLLDDLVSIMAVQAHKKGLKITFMPDPDVPARIQGDPTRLRQILTNLIGNAIKFTSKGEVVIGISKQQNAEENQEIKESVSKTTLLFTISDTGIGIPEDKIKTLFNKFSQVDTSTTRKFGGTGMGLVISKQLTAMMGGKIGVESVYGQGSKFWFTICFVRQEDEMNQALLPDNLENKHTHVVKDDHKSSRPAMIRNFERKIKNDQDTLPELQGHVLVAEDTLINQKVALGVLKKLGLSADIAINGAEAVKAVQNKSYDLVLMDMHMPEMDGLCATRKIRQMMNDESGMLKDQDGSQKSGLQVQKVREDDPDSSFSIHHSAFRIPIIAMTAAAMDQDKDKCLEAGMDDYISK
ncbi:MAG: MASE3 domain-containing protein, partial [Desulfonatronovibrio sp.]